MAEGQGLLKLLPTNLTRSFSAHCSARNPTKENNFISFHLKGVEWTNEYTFAIVGLDFCCCHCLGVLRILWGFLFGGVFLFWFVDLFVWVFFVCVIRFANRETWKAVAVNRPQRQKAQEAVIYLLCWLLSFVWKRVIHLTFPFGIKNISPMSIKCLSLSSPVPTIKAEKLRWALLSKAWIWDFFTVFLCLCFYQSPNLVFPISYSPFQKGLIFVPHSGVFNLISSINQTHAPWCCTSEFWHFSYIWRELILGTELKFKNENVQQPFASTSDIEENKSVRQCMSFKAGSYRQVLE